MQDPGHERTTLLPFGKHLAITLNGANSLERAAMVYRSPDLDLHGYPHVNAFVTLHVIEDSGAGDIALVGSLVTSSGSGGSPGPIAAVSNVGGIGGKGYQGIGTYSLQLAEASNPDVNQDGWVLGQSSHWELRVLGRLGRRLVVRVEGALVAGRTNQRQWRRWREQLYSSQRI
jgi:hypothetical protein